MTVPGKFTGDFSAFHVAASAHLVPLSHLLCGAVPPEEFGGVIGASVACFLSLRQVEAVVIERVALASAASGKSGDRGTQYSIRHQFSIVRSI